ncbi:MAG: NUDIX hydrolase [Micrococcales bacterium]|nr:NUDIX hydrolase [Micrococcales bacterium]
MSWPTTSRATVYQNPWITVTEDAVTRPDGTDGIYGVVELRHAAVFVVAVTPDDQVLLVTVERHTVGRSIEVPSGGTDGQDPLAAAQRELAEETGYVARSWRRVGQMSALNGICRAPELVYLATDLSRPASASDSSARRREGIGAVQWVPMREVLAMVQSSRITDGETMAALFLALLELGRVS